MAYSKKPPGDRFIRPGWPVVWVVLVSLGFAGCRGGMHDAASLPVEFRVPPARKASLLNLTRLAVPGSSGTQIGEGDVVELTLTTGFETDRVNPFVMRVASNGSIRVPLVGEVVVEGLEPAEAEQNIASLAVERGVYRNPSVTLVVNRQKMNKVTVVGAVETPGVYELPRSSSDLLGALAMSGGRTEEASMEVEILRKSAGMPGLGAPSHPGKTPTRDSLASYAGEVPVHNASVRVSLDRVSQGKTADYRLSDGDVVMVYPEQPRVIHVIGLVQKPGQFEVPPGEDIHVLDALALAGGRTMQLADDVNVVRRVPGRTEPVVIRVSVGEAKRIGAANLRLAAGDLVTVEETPVTMVLDLLRGFVRFGISASAPLF